MEAGRSPEGIRLGTATMSPPPPVTYDGDGRECSICTEAFRQDQRVYRLLCRHMFHAQCWDFHAVLGDGNCPNCRGAGTLSARWNYIEPGVDTQQGPTGPVPNELAGESRAAEPSVNSPETQNSSGTATTDVPTPSYLTTEGDWESLVYHVRTQLPDGRIALLIDPGSVGNLSGDRWAKSVAQAAARNGRVPKYEKRDRPLQVSGVGKGAQTAPYDCMLPIALQSAEEGKAVQGMVKTPTVANSDLPGLLGCASMIQSRAILDFATLKLYFAGPGDYNLDKAMPPGTEVFQCERAPSGHILLPCCSYPGQGSSSSDSTLSLMTQPVPKEAPPGLEKPFQ